MCVRGRHCVRLRLSVCVASNLSVSALPNTLVRVLYTRNGCTSTCPQCPDNVDMAFGCCTGLSVLWVYILQSSTRMCKWRLSVLAVRESSRALFHVQDWCSPLYNTPLNEDIGIQPLPFRSSLHMLVSRMKEEQSAETWRSHSAASVQAVEPKDVI